MSVQFVTDAKIAETSSKGNQEKWFDGGRWYKLDQFGYEALAETLISRLLERSNIERDTPFCFTRYRMERMNVHGRERTGCSSESFLPLGQSIITLSHLFKRCKTVPLKDSLAHLSGDKKRIAYLAETTAELTGLELFPQYLTLLFEIDALFLNDDRHLNNIAVLEQDGRYDYCPIFDNGAGLLSNVQLSPTDIDPKALIRALRARPFNTTFNRQLGNALSMYGRQLHMPKLTRDDIYAQLAPLLTFYAERDRGIIADRVFAVISERQKSR
ncbi:MAG: hypothetical protein Q4E35_04495 [Eubacteriales bacterium]|nr:hypothetical protein [Eubacteriales bacterium]